MDIDLEIDDYSQKTHHFVVAITGCQFFLESGGSTSCCLLFPLFIAFAHVSLFSSLHSQQSFVKCGEYVDANDRYSVHGSCSFF